jgi:hypothetical protein
MVYASRTKVPVDKTRMDIERLVKKYGAKGFASAWQDGSARVEFLCQNRHVRLTVETRGIVASTVERERWRALLLLVKAKLVAVEAKIATFEQAFVGDIVLPETGKTVWESVREPLKLAYEQNRAVPLLPGG